MKSFAGREEERTRRGHRLRTRLLQVGFGVVALACAARAAQLQLVETERWRAIAESQNSARIEIPAERGGIYDRQGRPMALDSQEFRVYLAPGETPDPDRAAATISRVLGLSPAEERRLRRARSGWVAVPRSISVEERDRLRAAVRRGLHFERLADRVYPQGDLARPVLGALRPEGTGATGLEMALDSLLRGEAGSTLARRDARGGRYRLPDARLTPPDPGHDVRLTLDAELQRLAEDALERGLRETGASGGDLLMLDPRTGGILALASRRIDGGSRVPALTDPYEPGSTLKPFLLASLLAEGRAELSDTVDTEGGVWRHGGRTIEDVHGEPEMTVAEVVRFSSNVGAAKLAERLPRGLQYRYLRDFGFGLPTGVDYPSESSGRLRRPDEWSGLSQVSLAMGYEISVTSLQLAAAYGALANGGVLMRPYLVHSVRDRSGRVVRRNGPEPVRRVVPPEVARQVAGVLSEVVDGGTGSRAALSTLPVAGKTGTARVAAEGGYSEGRYAASFVGFTPASDPRLVILAKLDDPQGDYYGGLTAAPISRSTLQAALATRGVALPRGGHLARSARRLEWGGSDGEPEGTPAGAVLAARTEAPAGRSRSATAAGGGRSRPDAGRGEDREGGFRVLPDLRGQSLRGAAARLHQLGLRVHVDGSGTVQAQDPPPGARLAVGATVVLR